MGLRILQESVRPRIFITGFATCEEASLGRFVDPPVPADDRRPLFPESHFRFHDSVTPSDAAASSSANSLNCSGISIADIDFAIACTNTPDTDNPSLVARLLHKLSRSGVPGMEIRQLGVGPILAIDTATRAIAAGNATCVLVCGVELLSRYFDEKPRRGTVGVARGVCGDGVGSFLVIHESVLERVGQKDFVFEHLLATSATLGIAPDLFSIPLPSSGRFPVRLTADDVKNGDHLPRINVESLFAHTMHYLPEAVARTAGMVGVELDRLGACASHQIVQGSNAAFCSMSELPPQNVLDCFETHGFIGAAGIPLTLALMHPSFLPGMQEVVGLISFSTGPSWGVSFMRMI